MHPRSARRMAAPLLLLLTAPAVAQVEAATGDNAGDDLVKWIIAAVAVAILGYAYFRLRGKPASGEVRFDETVEEHEEDLTR